MVPNTPLGLMILLAAVSFAAEVVLAVLLWKTHPEDAVGAVSAALMGVALLVNFVAGVAVARRSEADRRREAELSAELARLLLHAPDLQAALDRAGQHLAQALELPFASIESGEAVGDGHRCAIPLRDGAAVVGTLILPADLPATTEQRLRQRVVPSLEPLLAAAHDREHVNDALIKSREELQRFFDLASDMLCICDIELLAKVNPAFERTLGYRFEDVADRPFIEIVVPEDRDRVRAILSMLGPDETVRFDDRCLCGDGSLRTIEWNVREHSGLFYVAGRDVTDQRRERDQLRRTQDRLSALAEQQAALRRVATLVARGRAPSEVFEAVAAEMRQCLHTFTAAWFRFENGDEVTLVAASGAPGLALAPVGQRMPIEGDNLAVTVLRTGAPARQDSLERAAGPLAEHVRGLGIRAAVGVPIIVAGHLWGFAVVGSAEPGPMPPDTEERVSDFADLAATAIANAAARAELVASRARIVAAGDEARRRLERDLHDGAQQRLVSLGLQVRLTEKSIPPQRNDLKERLSQIVSGLTGVEEDLQEFSRGIHPMLSRGLDSAIGTLALRSAVPVTVDVAIDQRLPESAEVAAYYVVSEALTNAAKHAQASEVNVSARAENGNLDLVIQDDGVGGADSHKGSGLIGLMDRVEAVGGRLEITSQVGSGTSLHVEIPLANS